MRDFFKCLICRISSSDIWALLHVCPLFSKGNYFCDFLFASLEKKVLSEWDLIIDPFHSG